MSVRAILTGPPAIECPGSLNTPTPGSQTDDAFGAPTGDCPVCLRRLPLRRGLISLHPPPA